jgi:hypothetical protein
VQFAAVVEWRAKWRAELGRRDWMNCTTDARALIASR